MDDRQTDRQTSGKSTIIWGRGNGMRKRIHALAEGREKKTFQM